MPLLCLILFTVFLTLGLIHIFWALGGRWAYEKAIPINEKGQRIFSPGVVESTVVGISLISFGVFYLNQGAFISLKISRWILDLLQWIIPGIFILRAIGEFKYVGFFKRVRSTTFGKLDSKIYSPLCLLIGVLGVIINFGAAEKITELELKLQFDKYDVDGCFVLFDQTKNEYYVYNKALCDTGYIPASTFKIPHSLIVLEEGLIQDTNQIIPWNGKEWPVESWNQDQTLKTAFRYSCVWAYAEFAEQLGIDKYPRYLDLFSYGNKNLEGPPAHFWLSGSLRINAIQQVNFLRKMYNYEFAISDRSIDIVKDILILKKSDSYILSGKTGAGVLSDTEYIMWLVGYIERESSLYFYALNFVSDNYNATAHARKEIVNTVLKVLELIEK